jgi:hypothetical protein
MTPQVDPLEGVRGRLDLKAVVKRVKDVMRENEELGEMILQAGKGRSEEWQGAIDGECAYHTSFSVIG